MTLGVPAMPMATEIVEPRVINEEITVACIQVRGGRMAKGLQFRPRADRGESWQLRDG